MTRGVPHGRGQEDRGHRVAGPGFFVWEEDNREAVAWASELGGGPVPSVSRRTARRAARLPARMSARDAAFWYLERPHAPLHIGCVEILGGPLERRRLLSRFESRLGSLPRYAQRVVAAPLGLAHPSWEGAPAFSVRRHVRASRLAPPGGESDLVARVASLLEVPLDRARPLWEVHLIRGLHGGRTAILHKVHHAMIDGMAGAHLLEVLFDGTPNPRRPGEHPARVRALPPFHARLGRAITDDVVEGVRRIGALTEAFIRPAGPREAAGRVWEAACAALQLAREAVEPMPWNAPVGPYRRLAFLRLPMDGVRRARAATGGTVNDVFLAVLAGGLQRYLQARGIATSRGPLAALVPVSLRDDVEAASLGNRFSALCVPLVLDATGERERLRATREATEELKMRAAWRDLDALCELAEGLPAGVVALASRRLRLAGIANLIATSVPGPRAPESFCGVPIEALYPVVPIADGIGLGVAAFSYAGGLHVGINADAERVPDVGKLGLAMEESFQALVSGLP
jgi:diacylglycerol O-acyltransferase / wax synthase